MEKIRSALEIPRFDVNILADTTSPELLIDDGDPDNDEVHVWSRIEDFEEYLEKLAAASDLTTRIKSFNLQLVMAYNTYSLFLSAAARSFWYAEALTVQTAVSRCDGYNIDFEDDTLSEIQSVLMTTPHTGPPKPESVVLTSPLLKPFVAAGILASTTHLTLTASASSTFEYIPQEVTAGLPCLRGLNMYNIREDPGQPTIHFGLVSDLRVPSLSFIDICSPSNEVRCLGIKVTNDDLDRLVPEETESLLLKIATTFPNLEELETVSPANTVLQGSY